MPLAQPSCRRGPIKWRCWRRASYCTRHHQKVEWAPWNAGIIGYYQGGSVVNLDGLVNDSIYQYAMSNTLPVYVEKIAITYIVDFGPMLHQQATNTSGAAMTMMRLSPGCSL